MSKRIDINHSATGDTLYMLVFRLSDGFHWRTTISNLEARIIANWADYDIPMIEGDTATNYFYTANLPTHANFVADHYGVLIYSQAGGSPAITDALVGRIRKLYFDGTDIIESTQPEVTLILEDTGTTLPVTLAALATAAALATMEGKIDTIDGLVDTILVSVEKNRKVLSNKVIVTPGSPNVVDVYEDNGSTIAFTLNVSVDGNTRTAV